MTITPILFDGVKATSLIPTGYLWENGWNWLGTGMSPLSPEVRERYETVGLLYACVHIRAKSLKKVPWTITTKTGETVWKKGDPPPAELEFMKHLPRLLYKTEAALTLGSQAYWHKERNRVRTLNVKWLAPASVEPYWDEEEGILHFDRRLGARIIRLPVEDVVYIWYQHPQFETIRDVSPAEAAMAAANVLYNVDMFTKGFFERGAIKAMILGVSGNPRKDEMDRIKNWWNRTVAGVKNAFKSEVVNADTIKPVVIGEGLAELTNVELTDERRNDIAISLGIPLSMVFSDAANYATAEQDEKNFYNTTIVPECEIIAEQLNDQLFDAYGYEIHFNPEAMDIFQQDEVEKSNSFKTYVDTGIPIGLAAEMVGIDLPDGWDYDKLTQAVEEQKDKNMQRMQEMSGNQPSAPGSERDEDEEDPNQNRPRPGTPRNPRENQRSLEIKRFKAWASKRSSPDIDRFESKILSPLDKLELLIGVKGGPGSGNWGHGGRPGKEGGSVARGLAEGTVLRGMSRGTIRSPDGTVHNVYLRPGTSGVEIALHPDRGGSINLDSRYLNESGEIIKTTFPFGGVPIFPEGSRFDRPISFYRESLDRVALEKKALLEDLSPGTGKLLSEKIWEERSIDDEKALSKQNVTLSPGEKKAVNAYSGERGNKLWERINPGLISGDISSLSKSDRQAIVDLDSAVKKGKIPRDMYLYRGVKGVGRDLEVGNMFGHQNFVSTSIDPKVGNIFTDTGGVTLVIRARQGQTGLYIENLTKKSNEYEVILPRGSIFRITRVIDTPDGMRILEADYEELEG